MLDKQGLPVIWLLSYMKKQYYVQFANDSELCLSKKTPKCMPLKKPDFERTTLFFMNTFLFVF